MKPVTRLLALALVGTMAACATVPTGPNVMALPGTGKNMDLFRVDDFECRNYAQQQIGGSSAEQVATDSGVKSAVVGTMVGALAGAAFGGRNSTGTGAGVGLLFGSMAGSEASSRSAYATQRRYDNAYVQCMYAKGHRVPVAGSYTQASQYSPPVAPQPAVAPPAAAYPPPPPGYPPPPPPGAVAR